MWSNLLYYLLIALIVIGQISLLSNFHFWQDSVNLILVIVIFSTLWRGYKVGIVTAIIAGFIYDTYSVLSFGTHIISFVVPVIIANSLFKNRLANKSIINLTIIMVASTAIYHFCLLGLTYLLYFLNLNVFNLDFNLNYLYLLIKQIVLNPILLILILFIVKFMATKIKSRFLIVENL